MTVIKSEKTLNITSSKISVSSPAVIGEDLVISATAEGAGNIQYRFVAVSGSYKKVIKDYSSSNVVSWTPEQSGTYNIYIVAKDSTGKTVQKVILGYVVKDAEALKISSIKTNLASPQNSNKTITITVNSSSSGSVLYRFWEYNVDGSFKLIKDYSTTNTLTWTPKISGNYVIMVEAMDNYGMRDMSFIDYKIK